MYLPFKLKRLDVTFDTARLRAELDRVPAEWWVVHHFDDTQNEVVPLVTHGGTIVNEDGTSNHKLVPPFLPTRFLEATPFFAEVLRTFGTPSRARLMRIGPRADVKPHQDRHPHWNDKVRIHIPIVTNPEVLFHVWSDDPALPDGERASCHMAPGEAWIFNGWYFHGVTNGSQASRVHLVGDFEVRGAFADLVFQGCSEEERRAAVSYAYPSYETSADARRWANG